MSHSLSEPAAAAQPDRRLRFWAGLQAVLAVFAIAVSVYVSLGLQPLLKQKKELQGEISRMTRQRDATAEEIRVLDAQRSALEAQRNALKTAVDTLLPIARSVAGGSQQSGAIAYAENTTLTVGFYALQVDLPRYRALRDTLLRRGFNVVRGNSLDNRARWLSPRSTVLYYGEGSQGRASDIARLMEELTGDRFATAQGGGLGVAPGEEQNTFFIHWIPDGT